MMWRLSLRPSAQASGALNLDYALIRSPVKIRAAAMRRRAAAMPAALMPPCDV
jgi:hypothetical protein